MHAVYFFVAEMFTMLMYFIVKATMFEYMQKCVLLSMSTELYLLFLRGK